MNTRLQTLAPALFVVALSVPALSVPALAQIRMDTPAEKAKIGQRAAEDRKTDAALMRAVARAKRLPAAQRSGIAGKISAQSAAFAFSPQKGEGSSLFNSMAATDKDACIAYFTAKGARFAQLGFETFKDEFVADQLKIVGLVFDGTKLGQLATETMGKLKAGTYDKAEMKKTLDLIAGAVMYGYEQKGGATVYSAQVGQSMAEAIVVGAIMSQPGQDAEFRPILQKIQAGVGGLSAPSDLEPELGSPIRAFATGTFKDGSAVIEGAGAVTGAYQAFYKKS